MDFISYVFFVIVIILGTVSNVESLFPKMRLNQNGRLPSRKATKAGFQIGVASIGLRAYHSPRWSFENNCKLRGCKQRQRVMKKVDPKCVSNGWLKAIKGTNIYSYVYTESKNFRS